MSVSFIDKNGHRQQIELGGMGYIKEALSKQLSVRQFINQKFETQAGLPETFKQMCASAGLRFKADEELGIPSANLAEIFDPSVEAASTSTTQPAVPDSRWLFLPALLTYIEDNLQGKQDKVTNALDSLVGYRKSVNKNRVEQPVISYKKAGGPEDASWQYVGQNAAPPVMLSLTSSDVSRTIPTQAIGMEISMEALQSNSLDIVALTFARFYKMAGFKQWIENLNNILNGDPDATDTPMASCKSALASKKVTHYDSTISSAGVMTQAAWLKYLLADSLYMTKTHAIMDQATAIAIDNRTNRPTNVQNNSVDRLDVPFRVIWPSMQSTIDFVVLPPEASFPANTFLGLDRDFAIARIDSTFADYAAYENVVMRKSTQIRIDKGFILFRLYDEAFSNMTLTI